MDQQQTRIGLVAAEIMAQIEAEHPEGRIGAVGVVVQVNYDGHQVIESRTNCDAPWVSAGLFRRAMLAFDDERGGAGASPPAP